MFLVCGEALFDVGDAPCTAVAEQSVVPSRVETSTTHQTSFCASKATLHRVLRGGEQGDAEVFACETDPGLVGEEFAVAGADDVEMGRPCGHCGT